MGSTLREVARVVTNQIELSLIEIEDIDGKPDRLYMHQWL
jgi:hypothetical protein